MTKLEVTEKNFNRLERDFDEDKFFKYSYGITTLAKEPSEVVLSFTPEQGNYIKTQSLHHSVKRLKDDDKEYRIQMKVIISYELIQDILGWGKSVKVIKPKKLIDKVTEIMEQGLKQYN